MSYVAVRESIRDFIMDPFHDLDFRFSNAKTLTGNDIFKRTYPANPGTAFYQFIQTDIDDPVKIAQFPLCKFYVHPTTTFY